MINNSRSKPKILIVAILLGMVSIPKESQPISENIPPIIGGTTFVATTALGLGAIWAYNTDRGNQTFTPTPLNVVGSLGVIITAALLGNKVYQVLNTYTPMARYHAAKLLVSSVFAKELTTAHLETAIVMLDEIIEEIGQDSSYKGMHKKCENLFELIVTIYYENIVLNLEYVKQNNKVWATICDESVSISDDQFLRTLNHNFGTANNHEIRSLFENMLYFVNNALEDSGRFKKFIDKHQKIKDKKQCKVYEENIKELKPLLNRLALRIESRILLLKRFEWFEQSKRALNDLQSHAQLSELYKLSDARLTDEQFVTFVQGKYSGQNWYKTVKNELTTLCSKVTQALVDTQSLLSVQEPMPFSGALNDLKNSLERVSAQVHKHTSIMTKYAAFHEAQTAVDDFCATHKWGHMLTQGLILSTDEQVGDWVKNTYGMHSTRVARDEATQAKDKLERFKTDLVTVAHMRHAQYLDAQCSNLITTLNRLLEQLNFKLKLLTYYIDASTIKDELAAFTAQYHLTNIIGSSARNLSLDQLLHNLRHSFFSHRWRLIAAHEQLDQDISTLLGIVRRAKALCDKGTQDATVSLHLHKCRSVLQDTLEIQHQLVDKAYQLRECRAYRDEVTQKRLHDEQERQRQQAAQAQQGGAPQAGIADRDINCLVCLSQSADNDQINVLTCCRSHHYVCQNCLNGLRAHGHNCPNCRANMVLRTTTYSLFRAGN